MRTAAHGRPTVKHLAATMGILAGIILLAGGRAAAQEPDELSVTAVPNGPGWITIYFQHSDPDDVLWYVVEREGGGASGPLSGPAGYWTDVGLEPDTDYRYQACAIPEDGQRSCSDWGSARTHPLPGRPANLEPPIITNIELAPDAIKVTWGPTGDYTKILARIDDDQGNHFQVDLGNTPNGSYTFNGLRPGALYRVILKGCSFSLNSGCGPWSPDVLIPTPLPPQPLLPPTKPQVSVADYSATSVTLEFSVMTNRASDDNQFIVLRDGQQLAQVAPDAGLGGYHGSYTDPAENRHEYVICFAYTSSDQVCSDPVARPLLVSERPVVGRPDKCVVRLGGCEDPVHPDTCISGYVWREAFVGDTVCVTPEVRAQTAEDNAQADARREPGGGLNCISGYVWREARPEDLVCVTPETRAQTAVENAQANERRLVPR